MATINKELEALTLEQINQVSERFLLGWHDPKYDGHNFRIKGLNHKRDIYGLKPLTKEWSYNFRIEYIKSHFSDSEIEKDISEYCLNNNMESARWTGIEILDCRFGREYAKIFKELLGASKWRKISEAHRVTKLTTTQIEKHGGVGVAGKEAYDKMVFTKINKNRNLKRFESVGEEIVYDLLVQKFGENDVIYQYGIHPADARYPYSCDFYIKSLDLFIELNTHFSHSDYWFDSNNHDDLLKVKNWEQKGGRFLKTIKQWTISDTMKRKSAIDNHLNFLVFWDGRHIRNTDKTSKNKYVPILEDFKKWYYDYNCNVDTFLRDNPRNTY